MPSPNIHEKYARLMGIPIKIAREINKFIDDPRWHDFFDSMLERTETPEIRAIGGRIITYYFRGALFYTIEWENVRKFIERFGEDGWRAFFLHIWLDLIERNMRSGKGFAWLELKTFDYYKEYIDETGNFLDERRYEVFDDIRNYIARRIAERELREGRAPPPRRIPPERIPPTPVPVERVEEAFTSITTNPAHYANLIYYGVWKFLEEYGGTYNLFSYHAPILADIVIGKLKKLAKEKARGKRGREIVAGRVLLKYSTAIAEKGLLQTLSPYMWTDIIYQGRAVMGDWFRKNIEGITFTYEVKEKPARMNGAVAFIYTVVCVILSNLGIPESEFLESWRLGKRLFEERFG